MLEQRSWPTIVKKCYKLTDVYRGHKGETKSLSNPLYWEIKTITKKILAGLLMRNYAEYRGTEVGDYVVLSNNTDVIMSNTKMEISTNYRILSDAKADVLIFGLGLGMVPFVIQDYPEVKSITIVEINQAIINKVQGMKILNNKVKIISGDAYTNNFGKQKFDCIWADIWNTVGSENYEEMKAITKLYRKNVNYKNGGWIDCWRKDDCKRRWREEAQDRAISHVLYKSEENLRKMTKDLDKLNLVDGVKL